MTRTRRALPLLLVLLGVAVLLAPLGMTRADAITQQVVIAGSDFATDVFGDPWDMSNRNDINLDPHGATSGVTGMSLSGGAAHYSTASVSYVSLLWQGVSGSLPWGRDGRLVRNRIDASRYTAVHLHIYASRTTTVWVQWFTSCAGCTGHIAVSVRTGWNNIDASLTQSAHTGAAWSGQVIGLRLLMVTSIATTFAIDSARVYQPSSAGILHWAAPASSAARLFWSDTGLFVGSLGQHSGVVTGATSANSGATTATNVSGYPPSTAFFAYDGGTAVQVGVTAREPGPIIDSPTSRGCGDYAVAAVGHPWRFTSPRSLAGMANVTNVTYNAAGTFSATNAAPHRNDPYVFLPLGSTGIDGRVWHRLTVTESYDGGFSLANAPGGGTMARIMWLDSGHSTYSQTDDLVTPTGRQAITLDMAMPASTLTDPTGTAAQRYAFAGTSRIRSLRWDPNEDPGSRRWHLYSVVLARDCAATVAFTVTWHDTAFVQGSTVTIVVRDSAGRTHTLASNRAEISGSNSFRIVASSLPVGRYVVRMRVTSPSGASHVTEAGPLVIARP